MPRQTAAAPAPETAQTKPPVQDGGDQALEQMFGYYTRERRTPRVVTDLESRAAA